MRWALELSERDRQRADPIIREIELVVAELGHIVARTTEIREEED